MEPRLPCSRPTTAAITVSVIGSVDSSYSGRSVVGLIVVAIFSVLPKVKCACIVHVFGFVVRVHVHVNKNKRSNSPSN